MTFELSDQHVAIIGEALANTPYKISAPVLAELQKQINEQAPTPAPAPAVPAE